MKSNLDKWGHLGLNAILALVFFAYTNHIENTITKRLTGYLDTQRYDREKLDHQRWGDEHLTRINGSFVSIDGKLDRLSERVNDIDRKLASILATVKSSASTTPMVKPDGTVAYQTETDSGR